MQAVPHEIRGESVSLLPERAMYWPRERTLFVADFHLGKVAAFRHAGMALPSGTTTHAVMRLSRCIAATQAERIVFLGDFLHSKTARAPRTLERFASWRNEYAQIDITLVRGNHDAHAGDPPGEWRMTCVEEGEMLGAFVLAHHPGALVGGYALCGHIHPAVRLTEQGGDGLRLPCFWFTEDYGVLPAFGEFTGSATIRPSTRDRLYVVADDRVIAV
jgi:DNA ligase-associated metallophosphoesterase